MVLYTTQVTRDHSVNIVDNISPKFHKYDSFSTQLRITNCHLALSSVHQVFETWVHAFKMGCCETYRQKTQIVPFSHIRIYVWPGVSLWLCLIMQCFNNNNERIWNGFLGQVLRERQGGLGRKQTHCHLQLSKVSTLKVSTTGQGGLNFVHEIRMCFSLSHLRLSSESLWIRKQSRLVLAGAWN